MVFSHSPTGKVPNGTEVPDHWDKSVRVLGQGGGMKKGHRLDAVACEFMVDRQGFEPWTLGLRVQESKALLNHLPATMLPE